VNQSLTRTPLGLQGERLGNAILNAGEDVTSRRLQAMLTRLEGRNGCRRRFASAMARRSWTRNPARPWRASPRR
jgi:hypothetical protein